MATTHPTAAIRNAMADHIVDQLDGGTLEFQTSGDVEVATCTFGTPAFGAAAAGVASANTITADTSATGGVIDHAVWKTSGATIVVRCDCGTSGSDINLSSLTITGGDTVSISALTYTTSS